MPCDTWHSRTSCQPLRCAGKKKFVVQQSQEPAPFIETIPQHIAQDISELEHLQICTFFEAVGHLGCWCLAVWPLAQGQGPQNFPLSQIMPLWPWAAAQAHDQCSTCGAEGPADFAESGAFQWEVAEYPPGFLDQFQPQILQILSRVSFFLWFSCVYPFTIELCFIPCYT